MWSFWHSKDFEFTGLWVIVFERFMSYMDTQSIQVQSTFSPGFHNTDPVSNRKDSIAVEHMIDLRAHIHAERITLRTRLCKQLFHGLPLGEKQSEYEVETSCIIQDDFSKLSTPEGRIVAHTSILIRGNFQATFIYIHWEITSSFLVSFLYFVRVLWVGKKLAWYFIYLGFQIHTETISYNMRTLNEVYNPQG